MVIIYVTHPNISHARRVSETLLAEHLVTCVNYFPIKSAYWWRGKLVKDSEVVSILKTASKNWARLKKRIDELHSYEVPCIMKVQVEANKAYEDWINSESKPG